MSSTTTNSKANGNGNARKRRSKGPPSRSTTPTMLTTQRTPKSSRFDQDAEEEVRMGLLGDSSHSNGHGNGNGFHHEDDAFLEGGSQEKKESTAPLTQKDKYAITLLIILYLIQGIPIGLAFGSIPFLLKSKLSYSQLGTFSLATFPYSLKLLHAPVVDAIFHNKFGRRKSWIVPIQAIMGTMMIWMGSNTSRLIETDHPDVIKITAIFTLLVFFAATQDIAVDGWALTLLSEDNLSYASTAQTAGLNIGYFLSFTVFLALNSPDLANKYFRAEPSPIPFVSLSGYLRFWGFACYGVTMWLIAFKKEDQVKGDGDDLHLGKVYKSMWDICKLRHVQLLCAVHMISKIGFQANDAVTSLKMVEKGLPKEDLALIVLIDFPFQIIGGWVAARWSTGNKALRPWLYAFWLRLGFAVFSMLVIKVFPTSPIPMSFFLMLIITNVLQSFIGTVQFVGISAFHTQIADPMIGGTYMTLLNTISNMGGTWPRYFVLRGVDYFSVAHCEVTQSTEKGTSLTQPLNIGECVSDEGKAMCIDKVGTCIIERDGYYYISSICVAVGVITLLTFIWPTAKKLQALPHHVWRLKPSTP